jgi:hypothetical protein
LGRDADGRAGTVHGAHHQACRTDQRRYGWKTRKGVKNIE